jgi:hypothetical protein
VKPLFLLLLLCATATVSGTLVDHADFDEVHPVLRALKLDDTITQAVWPDWVVKHDQEIRARLNRGDEDTIINWLLFGTSFTNQPRAIIDQPGKNVIATRMKDFLAALQSPGADERRLFARRLFDSIGYAFDSPSEVARLEKYLFNAIDRVIAEQQRYASEAAKAKDSGDLRSRLAAESRMFAARGVSLDTSILANFAIDQALQEMQRQRLAVSTVRRVAIIGPGLDFADKSFGYDFYPVQTLQPFALIDSLVRSGWAGDPEGIEVTVLDISPRVHDHIQSARRRAESGSPYVLNLPLELGLPWTPELLGYWRRMGDRIGAAIPAERLPTIGKGLAARRIRVKASIVRNMKDADFNLVTGKWSGSPFDLIVATNVLVYYDLLDQSLAFTRVESMLKPGGFFLTNNPVAEFPFSRLRATGYRKTVYSVQPEYSDHVFWYQRQP